MKKVVTIIGSGMMGSALAFPAAENAWSSFHAVNNPRKERFVKKMGIMNLEDLIIKESHLKSYKLKTSFFKS